MVVEPDDPDNFRKKIAAYRILAFETVITAVLVLLIYISAGGVAAWSVALGGGAFVVPNALFARYVFRHSAAVSADLAVRWFYVGEAIKLITTILIFAACFILVERLNVIALFATYVGLNLFNLAGLARMKTD